MSNGVEEPAEPVRLTVEVVEWHGEVVVAGAGGEQTSDAAAGTPAAQEIPCAGELAYAGAEPFLVG